MKNLFKKSVALVTLAMILSGCGASARGALKSQTVTVRDSQTKEKLAGVVLYANGEEVGITGENGKLKYKLEQANSEKALSLKAVKEGYRDITIKVENKVGGGYVVGNIVWLLMGGLPGIIAFSVDGVSGKWYVYKNRVTINMNPDSITTAE